MNCILEVKEHSILDFAIQTVYNSWEPGRECPLIQDLHYAAIVPFFTSAVYCMSTLYTCCVPKEKGTTFSSVLPAISIHPPASQYSIRNNCPFSA